MNSATKIAYTIFWLVWICIVIWSVTLLAWNLYYSVLSAVGETLWYMQRP